MRLWAKKDTGWKELVQTGNTLLATELLHEEHKRHPSLGYHRLARNILNEIIAHSVSPIAGDNKTYYDCLEKLNLLAGKKEEQKPQVVFHTDQGAVYSSRVFQHAHKDYNMLRSMSRRGTPTDNPIIEALNG